MSAGIVEHSILQYVLQYAFCCIVAPLVIFKRLKEVKGENRQNMHAEHVEKFRFSVQGGRNLNQVDF